MMTDPIADMLIRIKNGYRAGKEVVLMPYSRFKHEAAKIIVQEGKITKAAKSGSNLKIELKYDGKEPVLTDVKRVSRPSHRVYQKAKDLKSIQSGFGFSLVSTSAGLMTNKQAKKKNLGGEIICQIW